MWQRRRKDTDREKQIIIDEWATFIIRGLVGFFNSK